VSRATRRKKSTPRAEKKSHPRSISDVLALFDEAFTLVATAASAMESALDSTVVEDAAEPAEKVECLVRGVKGLRRARIEIAVALHEGGLR
jgi:hypothetical protein